MTNVYPKEDAKPMEDPYSSTVWLARKDKRTDISPSRHDQNN